MRVNKRFAPKFDKHSNLAHLSTLNHPYFSKPLHTEHYPNNQQHQYNKNSLDCPILFNLSPHFKNTNSLDVKFSPIPSPSSHASNHHKLFTTNNNTMTTTFSKQDPFFSKKHKDKDKDKDNQNFKQIPVTARKTKLQNLRSSIQTMQKLIQKSKQVINQSSFINNSSISPKTKVKSDSFDLKFNYSTRKVNSKNLINKKIYLLNSYDSSNPQESFREHLLMDSIQKAHQQKRAKQYLQFNDSTQSPQEKPKYNTHKNGYFSNDNQDIKSGNQLNSTLEKLLNQSFQSTGKPNNNKWVNSPSTTIMNQSPKYSKEDTQQFLNMKRMNLFKKKGPTLVNSAQNNDSTTKQVSFDDIHFPDNMTYDDLHPSEEAHKKILIDESDDDVIQNQDLPSLREIGALTAKNRLSYQGQSSLQDSYVRQQKENQAKTQLNPYMYPPKLLLKTPKAYKNYQENKQSKKDSKGKDWIPRNFVEFQNRVLNRKNASNVFRQTPNQGKFSPRIISYGKQNRNRQTSLSKQRKNGFQERQKKKNFINELYKYPFVQRYLKQADIVSIYDKLKKSKVPQQKWILFVIDQVHKKMKKQTN